MHLSLLTLDNFLDDFDSFEQYARSRDFSGTLNPMDGVVYPGISIDVPPEIAYECLHKVAAILGVQPSRISTSIPLSLRLTTAGTPAPHQAHTDMAMGQYNFILYLDDCDATGGTSVLEHVSGLKYHPTDKEQAEMCQADSNDSTKWVQVAMCQARKNRAVILPSFLFHRAEPIGGFGTSAANGRLVLLCFFSVEPQ